LYCLIIGGQTVILTPIQEDNLRTIYGIAPFACGWGYGGVINSSSYPMEDRTIIDFDLSSISATSVSNATLTFFIQNQQNGEKSIIDIFTFYDESTIQTNDWNEGIFYQSFGDDYGIHTLDLTSAVQSAINAGHNFLNLRMSTLTTNSSYFIIDPPWRGTRLNLTVISIPGLTNSLLFPPLNLRILN